MTNEVWVTGYGLVCAGGADVDACWDALDGGISLREAHPVTGQPYFPVRGFDPSKYISRRADQRQMGDLMQHAVAAASDALRSAGVVDGAEAAAALELCVATTSGERDLIMDEAAMAAARAASQSDKQAALNCELMKMRPSLFLAQLPNLVPSNICIVAGIPAASRTFMGGESAGIEVLRHAAERIRSGERPIMLAGASHNAGCVHMNVAHGAGGWLRREAPDNVWREDGKGYCMGTAAAFVVLESRRHAEARGSKPLATLGAVTTSFAATDDVDSCAERLFTRWKRGDQGTSELAVVSGITGDGHAARRERAFLARLAAAGRKVAARAPAQALGHSVSASFLTNVILAVAALQRGRLFKPLHVSDANDTNSLEKVRAALVTCWGTVGGEGFASLEAPV